MENKLLSEKKIKEHEEVLEEYDYVFKHFSKTMGKGIERAIEAISKTGDESYTLRGKERDLLMAFSKLERKFRRAEHITFNYEEILEEDICSEEELLEYLRDAYFDAMNYSIMAVYIVNQYLQKKGEKNE